MFYVIGVIRSEPDKNGNSRVEKYKLIDTLSESIWSLDTDELQYLIRDGALKVANADLHHRSIKVENWISRVTNHSSKINIADLVNKEKSTKNEKCEYILLAEDENDYRLTNFKGHTTKISSWLLKKLIDSDNIANCATAESLKNEERYQIVKNNEFEKLIALKYEAFITKALALGYGDVSFEYEIENNHVKLRKYTGLSTNIIIPSFITIIMIDSFRKATIETLNLNEGLQVIGAWAFAPMRASFTLKDVEIPSTVKLVGHSAFINNRSLYHRHTGHLIDSRARLRNDETILLEPIN